jgi:hypothetical protein
MAQVHTLRPYPVNQHRDLSFRCLVRRRRSSTRSRETHEHLEGIVYHPLQTGEGADHDDTTFQSSQQTLPNTHSKLEKTTYRTGRPFQRPENPMSL